MKKLFFLLFGLALFNLNTTAQTTKLLASESHKNVNLKLQSCHLKTYTSFYKDWNTTHVSDVHGIIEKGTIINLENFTMPTTHKQITSQYGKRWGRMHQGVDIKVYIGDTIKSAFDGVVRIASYDKNGYGYYIVIRHYNGLETLYAHLSKQCVKTNDIVKSGEAIGLGGNTGRSTGSHLHFEIRLIGQTINPLEIFDFHMQDLKMNKYYVKTNIEKIKKE